MKSLGYGLNRKVKSLGMEGVNAMLCNMHLDLPFQKAGPDLRGCERYGAKSKNALRAVE